MAYLQYEAGYSDPYEMVESAVYGAVFGGVLYHVFRSLRHLWRMRAYRGPSLHGNTGLGVGLSPNRFNSIPTDFLKWPSMPLRDGKGLRFIDPNNPGRTVRLYPPVRHLGADPLKRLDPRGYTRYSDGCGNTTGPIPGHPPGSPSIINR